MRVLSLCSIGSIAQQHNARLYIALYKSYHCIRMQAPPPPPHPPTEQNEAPIPPVTVSNDSIPPVIVSNDPIPPETGSNDANMNLKVKTRRSAANRTEPWYLPPPPRRGKDRDSRPLISHRCRRKLRMSQQRGRRSDALKNLFPQHEPEQQTKLLERLLHLTFR
jgi:hypothetical protein